jgi:hypothetical protein
MSTVLGLIDLTTTWLCSGETKLVFSDESTRVHNRGSSLWLRIRIRKVFRRSTLCLKELLTFSDETRFSLRFHAKQYRQGIDYQTMGNSSPPRGLPITRTVVVSISSESDGLSNFAIPDFPETSFNHFRLTRFLLTPLVCCHWRAVCRTSPNTQSH